MSYSKITALAVGLLWAGAGKAASFDHYTFQYGSGDSGTYTIESPSYGNASASAYAPFDTFTGKLLNASATAGYHDSLIINGGLYGTTGTLNIYYSLSNENNGLFDPGSSYPRFSGTGIPSPFIGPPGYYYGVSLLEQVLFNYGVPFSLDAQVTEISGAASGTGAIAIDHLSVSTLARVTYSSSSSTEYAFSNGTFFPTPEPCSTALVVSGLFGLIGPLRRKLRQA